MATTIACVNQKGGVGKTTTTATVGHALVREHGLRVLLVDMDPQASLTRGLIDTEAAPEASMHGVIADEVALSEVILPIEEAAALSTAETRAARQAAEAGGPVAGSAREEAPEVGEGATAGRPAALHLAPAHPQMNALVTILANMPGWATIVSDAIEEVAGDYDVVILDTRPNREHLEMLAMSGADSLLIPVNAAPYAMFATDDLMETIRLVRKRTNPELQLLGTVITQYDERNIVCREADQEIVEYFGDLVFETRIRRNTTLERVPSSAISILDFDPRANGALDYRALTEEVIRRVRG